jgi:protein TonB
MRIRQGGAVTAASLIDRVQPEYPVEAKAQHISGNVRRHAILALTELWQAWKCCQATRCWPKQLGGAVRQWRYRPTTWNGDPVEVDTTIDVVFSQ